MTTLDRTLESLAFCHVQDEHLWAAARVIVQQDVDEFMREAGPELADQLDALTRLMTEFERTCADQMDPVLIRSYMRRHIRRIEFDLKRDDDRSQNPDDASELTESPATSPEVHADSAVGPGTPDEASAGQNVRPEDTGADR
jgi:hypothetical protein